MLAKLIPELSIKWVIDSPAMFVEVQHVVIEKVQDTGANNAISSTMLSISMNGNQSKILNLMKSAI